MWTLDCVRDGLLNKVDGVDLLNFLKSKSEKQAAILKCCTILIKYVWLAFRWFKPKHPLFLSRYQHLYLLFN